MSFAMMSVVHAYSCHFQACALQSGRPLWEVHSLHTLTRDLVICTLSKLDADNHPFSTCTRFLSEDLEILGCIIGRGGLVLITSDMDCEALGIIVDPDEVELFHFLRITW